MLAEKVGVHYGSVMQGLDAIRPAIKFVCDHPTVTGGMNGDINDAIEALEEFADRLSRVENGLRRLESAN